MATSPGRMERHALAQFVPKKATRDNAPPALIHHGTVVVGWAYVQGCLEQRQKPRVKALPDLEAAVKAVVRTIMPTLKNASKSVVAAEAVAMFDVVQELVAARRRDRISEARNRASSGQSKTGNVRTASMLADAFGVSRAYVTKARSLARRRPDLLEEVRKGRITIHVASNQMKGAGGTVYTSAQLKAELTRLGNRAETPKPIALMLKRARKLADLLPADYDGSDMSWPDAIKLVLELEGRPLTKGEIGVRIADLGLRDVSRDEAKRTAGSRIDEELRRAKDVQRLQKTNKGFYVLTGR